jgi:hypothetical protein
MRSSALVWIVQVFLATFLLSNFLSLPPLISSPSSTSTPPFSLPPIFTDTFSLPNLINALIRPLWISLYVPQLLLNHRLGTFAGCYRLTAVLMLFQEIVGLLPRILTGLLGWDKWKAMEEVRVYDAVGMVMFAVQAWQAVRLPGVRQDREEDDEGAGRR